MRLRHVSEGLAPGGETLRKGLNPETEADVEWLGEFETFWEGTSSDSG